MTDTRLAQKPQGESSQAAATLAPARGWWLLLHQLPPQPPGLRMRVWRRLQELGALQIKGSVYLLPASEAAREDLQWLMHEIRAAGADASLWRAAAVDGFDDEDLVLRFQAQAAAEYEALEQEARELRQALRGPKRNRPGPADAGRRLLKLRARFDDIERRDFFAAPRREIAGALLADLAQAVENPAMPATTTVVGRLDRAAYLGRTWVTRPNVHIDRMASAWLIRRYIDPQARFDFVAADRPAASDALRFDMYNGEFTHEGERCTFEVLLERFRLAEPGLDVIAQIVHDIDLKEQRYAHPETTGVAAALDAIADGAADDATRLALAATVFDGLLKRFARSQP